MLLDLFIFVNVLEKIVIEYFKIVDFLYLCLLRYVDEVLVKIRINY